MAALKKCNDPEEFGKHVSEGKPVVFYFVNSWDAAGKIIAPYVETLADTNRDIINFYEVDLQKVQSVAKQYKVWQVPTFLFFNKGEQSGKYVGSIRSQLLNEVEKLKPKSATN